MLFQVLTNAVLAILITAPIGAVIIAVTGRKLLHRSSEKEQEEQEEDQRENDRKDEEIPDGIELNGKQERPPKEQEPMLTNSCHA